MKFRVTLLAQLACLILASSTYAQEASWQPSELKPPPPYSVQHAAFAKIYPDQSGTNVLGIISFAEGETILTTPKTLIRNEVRTISLKDPGATVEQSLNVMVPKQGTRSQPVIVKTRIEVPLEYTSAWTVGGKLLTIEEATKTLKMAKRCLLMPTDFRAFYQPDPFFVEMLKDDVLVIWYDQAKAKEIPAKDK